MIKGLADFDLWTHEYFTPDVISNDMQYFQRSTTLPMASHSKEVEG